MDAARPGDTVLIRAGVYHEPVGAKTGVTVKVADGETAWVDGGGGRSGIMGAGVQDFLLLGLGVRNWANLGNFQNCVRILVRGCVLNDGATSGLWAAGSTDIEFSGNTIARCGTGKGDDCFAFESCSRVLVSQNDVSRAAHAGIQLLNCDHSTVIRNIVHNCGSSGIIAKRQFNDGLIENNFVSHSAYSDESSEGRKDAGIQVVGSRSVVRLNRVKHCGGGIVLELDSDTSKSTDDNLIEYNTVSDAEDAGIDLAAYGAAGTGRMTRNHFSRNIAWGSRNVDLRLQIVGGGLYGGNTFDANVAANAQVIEGALPPFDTADPKLDPVTLASATYPDRGWQP